MDIPDHIIHVPFTHHYRRSKNRTPQCAVILPEVQGPSSFFANAPFQENSQGILHNIRKVAIRTTDVMVAAYPASNTCEKPLNDRKIMNMICTNASMRTTILKT